MNDLQNTFSDSLSSYHRFRRRIEFIRDLELILLFFLPFLVILIFVKPVIGGLFFWLVSAGFVTALGAIGVSWLFIVPSLGDTASLIDKAGSFKDRITAAFDLSAGKISSIFENLVLEEGTVILEREKPSTFFTYKPGKRFYSLCGIVLFLLIFIFGGISIESFLRPDPRIAREGLILEELGNQLSDRSRTEEERKLAEEMQDLGRRMQDEYLSEEETKNLLRQFNEKIEDSQSNLERDMEFPSESEISSFQEDAEDIFRLQKGLLDEDDLSIFRRRVAESEGYTNGQKQEAEEAFDDYSSRIDDEETEPDEAQKQLGDDLEDALDPDKPEQSENTEIAQEIIENALQSLNLFGNKPPGEGGEPGGDLAQGDPSPTGQGSGLGEGEPLGESEFSNTSGSSFGDDTSDDVSDYEPQRDGSRNSEDLSGIITEDSSNLKTYIRTLSMKGESNRAEQEIEAEYRRAVEEVIQSETIPPAKRDYLKDYFLAVGLTGGTKEE